MEGMMRKHAEILADGFLGKFAEFDRQTQAGWTRYHDRYGFEAHNPGCEVIIHWNPNWRNNDHLEDCDLRITTPDMSVNMVSGLRHAAIKDGYVKNRRRENLRRRIVLPLDNRVGVRAYLCVTRVPLLGPALSVVERGQRALLILGDERWRYVAEWE